MGKILGAYVCTVSKLAAGNAYTNLVDFPQTELIITAKWNGYMKNVEDSTKVPFHPALEVLENEVRNLVFFKFQLVQRVLHFF